MKKILFLAFTALLFFPVIAEAQLNNRAIGLRLGGGIGYGTEISYQQPFERNRAEIDLGFGSHSDWRYWNLTGIYQWVRPIESGFYWYLGVGPSLGSWSAKHDYDDYDEDDGGIFLAAVLNAGIEYNFTEIPLQLAIDTRPELGIANARDSFGFGLALGIRYRF